MRAEQSRAEQYLSKNYTQCIKGLAAVGVLIHHIYQYSGLLRGSVVGFALQQLGCLCVGVFFFYSGYGLMLSSKKDGYMEGFLKKRLIPMYSFYIFLIFLYLLFLKVINTQISAGLIIQSFFIGGTVVPLGWYLQITFGLYLAYYLIFSLFHTDSFRVIGMTFIVLAICIICDRFSLLDSQWYEGLLCVLLGMIWAQNKVKIDKLLQNLSVIIASGAGVFFSGLYVVSYVYDMIWCKMLAIGCFVIIVIAVSYTIANGKLFNNPITKLLGEYSMDIYVTQGIFLMLRKCNVFVFSIDYLFVPLTVIGTSVAAIAISVVRKEIYRICLKYCA